MASQGSRIRSVDILRGIVMVIMALDHTRDFFSNYYGNPLDLATTSTGMFLTRWITHFCAPVFIFLAGTSAYLSLSKRSDKRSASLFLLKRGTWLILLEITIVQFGWIFDLSYQPLFVQVIWAIGWSMVCLAAFIHLPFGTILTVGLLMIFGHNLLDTIQLDGTTGTGAIWYFLHQSGLVTLSEGRSVFVIYPLVPWIGVMATGYCFGKLLQQEQPKRDRQLYLVGGLSIVLFIVIRATNLYGNPTPWTIQESLSRTILSFLNCEKYPPSLLYLLMTLGPAILLMPMLEKRNNSLGRFFTVYGRVPMFYYILHIYLIHTVALVYALMLGLPANYFTDSSLIFSPKTGWGYELPVVYMVWAGIVLLLYYPCRWFMYVKQNNRQWWLSYI